jgi:HK97 gp10 family phage protein
MQTYTLLGFIAELETIKRDMEDLPKAIVARACAMIAKHAKAQIGKEHEEWPPLSASTIADKQHYGFPTPKPLLRTGEMRHSIEWTVQGHGSHVEGAVGSDDPRAVFHELGTSRMPARPFLVPSAIVCEPRIVKMAARMMISTLGGGDHNSRELRELLHLVRHAWHQIREDFEWLVDDEHD